MACEALPSLTFLIANRRPKPDFAHYVVEEVRTQTGGRVTMTPDNTVVACSTPAVIADYERLGFAVDPVELGTDEARPWDVMEAIIAAGGGWVDDVWIAARLHPVAREHYLRYGLADAAQQIHADPLDDPAGGGKPTGVGQTLIGKRVMPGKLHQGGRPGGKRGRRPGRGGYRGITRRG